MYTHLVSPHYRHTKLQPPFTRDVIDVFEDRVRYWIIEPAKLLLKSSHGWIPAVALSLNYIESIEIYISGEDSRNQSREFFKRGFWRIFQAEKQSIEVKAAIASALYGSLRCGFAHDGMARAGINFSTTWPQTFLVTWPKVNGDFDSSGSLESAIINPIAFVEGIEKHFNRYINDLKRGEPLELLQAFKNAVELKWGLGKPGRLVAMTEEEFFGVPHVK
jgi:hypothetical protein